MIVKTFDNGMGQQFPLKQFEQQILMDLLKQKIHSSTRTVVINSVWYTQEYHQQVLAELRNLHFDEIVLVAMIDASIPKIDWYSEFDCPVTAVGYYPGKNQIDFWALMVDKFFDFPSISELANPHLISIPFMCLNRKPHWHRVRLFNRLKSLNLIDRGLVSLGGTGQAVQLLLNDREHDNLAPNATRDQTGIPNDIASLGLLSNWQKSFLNVVTETVFDINQNHFVSEKIYKPVIGLRPFLIYDSDGAVQWLESRGFQTYVTDFQDISTLDLADPANIPDFLSVLCEQPVEYYRSKFLELIPKIVYNRTQFTQYVQSEHKKINQGIICQI